jgi:hypothetical protein
MATNVAANDWQVVGVAQVGGVVVVGAAIYLFEFRSLVANCRVTFLFIGAALGGGGDLGGGAGPSPDSVIHNTNPDLWTSISCTRPFSASDLDVSYGALSTLGAAGAYGYFLTGISAGLVDNLFDSQDVSGWGTGVGAVGAIMAGLWKMIGNDAGYY